jgi:hypothetical protein
VGLRSLDGRSPCLRAAANPQHRWPIDNGPGWFAGIGVFAQWIKRHAQERASNNLRSELITAMSEAAGRLNMACAHEVDMANEGSPEGEVLTAEMDPTVLRA